MNRCFAIVLLCLSVTGLYAQEKERADSLLEADGVYLSRNGERISDEEAKRLFLSSFADGAERYDDYVTLRAWNRRGTTLALSGLVVSGLGIWLQTRAFEVAQRDVAQGGNGCVSPGGIPIILGGFGMIGVGISFLISAPSRAGTMAIELNEKRRVSVTPAASSDGFGVIFNF